MKTNLLLFVSIIFLFSQPGISQTPTNADPKKLFWSEEPTCGMKNTSVTAEDNFTCSLLMEDQWKLRRFEYNGLTLTVRFMIWGKYFVAETYLANDTDKPKSFNIKEWNVVYFENEEAFKAGGKPISGGTSVKAPVLYSLEDLQKAQRDQQNNEISNLGGTILTREAGESVIRTTPKDASKSKGLTISNDPRMIKPSEKLRALTEKVVPAKKGVFGRVYFDLESRSQFAFFSMPVDGVFYVFPVPRTKKK